MQALYYSNLPPRILIFLICSMRLAIAFGLNSKYNNGRLDKTWPKIQNSTESYQSCIDKIRIIHETKTLNMSFENLKEKAWNPTSCIIVEGEMGELSYCHLPLSL